MTIGALCRGSARFCAALARKYHSNNDPLYQRVAQQLAADSGWERRSGLRRGLRTSAIRHSRDYYEILGVEKNANANEIKKVGGASH